MATGFGSDPKSSPDQTLQRDTVPESEVGKDEKPLSLWQRFFNRDRQFHAPGLSVLYFGLATLPLFGLGQLAIPASDLPSRRAAFGYLVVYVAAALGLLGTTSFLSVRRYLRQRRLQMPAEMAVAWSTSAALIICSILVLCSLFPRPRPAYSGMRWFDSTTVDEANHFSLLQSNGVESPDLPDAMTDPPKTNPEGASRQDLAATTSSGSARSRQQDQQERDGQEYNAQQRQRDNQSSHEVSTPSDQRDRNPGHSDESPTDEDHSAVNNARTRAKSSSNGNRTVNNDDAESPTPKEGPQTQDDGPGNQSDSSAGSGSERRNGGRRELEAPSNRSRPSANSPPPSSLTKRTLDSFTKSFQSVGGLLKWLFRILIAGILLILALRNFNVILAILRQFFNEILSLFAGNNTQGSNEPDTDSPVIQTEPPRPFSTFQSPFLGADRMQDSELVSYSFLALEAWARDRGCGRQRDETPLEFGKRLGATFPSLRGGSTYVVQLYGLLAYRGNLPAVQSARIAQLWQQL